MAIIKCPECNNEVSDMARQCPFCGVDIAGNIMICPDCGKIVLRTNKTCPNCKCDLKNTAPIPTFINSFDHNDRITPQETDYISQTSSRSVLRVVILTLLSLIVCGALGYGGYCFYKQYQHIHKMEVAYQQLQDNETIKELKSFLAQYPDSEYAKEVGARLDKLQEIQRKWKEICESSETEEFKVFSKQYPESQYAALCQEKVDSLEWQNACFENTTESYSNYLRIQKDGKYAEIAAYYANEVDAKSVTESEKKEARGIITKCYTAINARNTTQVAEVATPAVQNIQDKEATPGTLFRVKNIQVTKTPVYKDGTYYYVTKFIVEKRNRNNYNECFCYQGNAAINSEKKIEKLKLSFLEKKMVTYHVDNTLDEDSEDNSEYEDVNSETPVSAPLSPENY